MSRKSSRSQRPGRTQKSSNRTIRYTRVVGRRRRFFMRVALVIVLIMAFSHIAARFTQKATAHIEHVNTDSQPLRAKPMAQQPKTFAKPIAKPAKSQ